MNKKVGFLVFILIAIGGFFIMAVLAGQESKNNQPNVEPQQEYRLENTMRILAELKKITSRYDDEISSLRNQLEEEKKSNSSLIEQLKGITSSLENLQKKQEEIFESANKEDPLDKIVSTIARLSSFDLEPDKNKKYLHVPAGSFAEATLLTGVYAPISGEPLPVLLRIDTLVIGPNKTRIPIKGAFVTGKAVGDANTSRAIVQLATLSTVNKAGKATEKQVNGYLADSDGIHGLKGRYIWNAQQIAGLSILSGAAEGAAGAFAKAQTQTYSSALGETNSVPAEEAVEFVGFKAAESSLSKVSGIIAERMKEFTPAIYVSNNKKKVTVIFLEGVLLSDFGDYEDVAKNAENYPFKGLDAFDSSR